MNGQLDYNVEEIGNIASNKKSTNIDNIDLNNNSLEENVALNKGYIIDSIISKIYISYIELVAKSSKITLNGDFRKEVIDECIVGFWHGDSFGMNFLLREIKNSERDLSVVVTIDKRGNFIEKIMNNYGVKALRMPDGIKMKGFLRTLKEKSKEKSKTLCITLDGPVGPYKDPKKVGFMLSNESEKPIILVNVNYSRKITLKNRWDKYVIPLPFSEIKFTSYNFGKIEKEELRDFEKLKKKTIDIVA